MRFGWHLREVGGGGSGRGETAVDEAGKETADRVAKYQTDYIGRTCPCYLYHKMLRLPQRCFDGASCSFLPLLFVLLILLY